MADNTIAVTSLDITITAGDTDSNVVITFTTDTGEPGVTWSITISEMLLDTVVKCLKQIDLLGTLDTAAALLARDTATANLQ